MPADGLGEDVEEQLVEDSDVLPVLNEQRYWFKPVWIKGIHSCMPEVNKLARGSLI